MDNILGILGSILMTISGFLGIYQKPAVVTSVLSAEQVVIPTPTETTIPTNTPVATKKIVPTKTQPIPTENNDLQKKVDELSKKVEEMSIKLTPTEKPKYQCPIYDNENPSIERGVRYSYEPC